jgi:alanine racemase
MPRRAVARVNLAAVERNCARLLGSLTGGAALGAVVKADGYGHGAGPVAEAARVGGATWLFVATAEEAAALRRAGVAGRLVVMGALAPEELRVALEADADVVAWRTGWVDALPPGLRVHVKLDTGMGRLGTRDPAEADAVAERVAARSDLELTGAMTHFATADADDPGFLRLQLERFGPWAEALRARHPGIAVHAANSAATLREPAAHFDVVRCGIAVYGLDPFGEDAAAHGLEPALELASWVAALKAAEPGDSAGYGRTWIADRPTVVATLPIGYADGVRRALSNACDVVIGGRRYPVRGTVSMDNLTVEVGPRADVAEGDEALIVGGGQSAEELARTLDTINYEIVTGISARVPRAYHRDRAPA